MFRIIQLVCVCLIVELSFGYIPAAQGLNNISLGLNLFGVSVAGECFVPLVGDVGVGIGGKLNPSLLFYSNHNIYCNLRLIHNKNWPFSFSIIYEEGSTDLTDFSFSYGNGGHDSPTTYKGLGVGFSWIWKELSVLIKINYVPISIEQNGLSDTNLLCGSTGIELTDIISGVTIGAVGPKSGTIYGGFCFYFDEPLSAQAKATASNGQNKRYHLFNLF